MFYGVTTTFIFIIIPFNYALLTKREVSMTGYMAKFLFCILLDFLDVLYFFLVGYATRLGYATSSVPARPHALKLASLTFKNL